MWTKQQLDAIYLEGKNIIVSAGAGSGKTAVLSERILQKVIKGVPLNSLLVLTFTKAAAYEMKQRIKKKISETSSVMHLASEVDNAYITTFDAYSLMFVKRYYYLLNIEQNIQIASTSILGIVKNKIINEIFEEHYRRLDDDFASLIRDFCFRNDDSLKQQLLSINDLLDLKYDRDEYLTKFVSRYDLDLINEYISQYYQRVISKSISDIESLAEELSDKEASYLKPFIGKIVECPNYDEVKDSLDFTIDLKGKTTSAFKQIKEIVKQLKIDTRYDSQEYIVNKLIENKKYLRIIIEIINEFDKRYNQYKLQHNCFDFIDIAKMMLKLLKNNYELLQEVKKSYSEILVDEYQDTSDIQEEFINLLENSNVYMVGDIKQSIYSFRNANPQIFLNKYNLYKDQKYGIRIDLLQNFRSRNEVVEAINLIFNQIMNKESTKIDYGSEHMMKFGNIDYNNQGKLDIPSNLEVRLYSHDKDVPYAKNEIEIFTIARDVIDKMNKGYQVYDGELKRKRPVRYEDFCILIDRATDFNLYQQIFDYLKIPLSIFVNDKVSSDNIILIIMNILKMLVLDYQNNYNEDYKHSYCSLARSFLFCYDDNRLFDEIVNKKFLTSEIASKIRKISKSLNSESNKNLITIIISEFNIYSRISLIGQVDSNLSRLEYIYDLASSITSLNLCGVDFINCLEELLESKIELEIQAIPSQEDKVKIMTIHKSKGLEFKVLYLAGLNKDFNLADIKERFIFNNEYGIITPYYDQGIGSTIIKQLMKIDYLKSQIGERVRLFYVALTRAKEKIIMVMQHEENRESGDLSLEKCRSFSDFMHNILPSMHSFISKIALEDLDINREYRYYNNINKIEITKSASKINYHELKIENNDYKKVQISKKTNGLIDVKQYQLQKLGAKLHSIMEHLDFINPNLEEVDIYWSGKVKQFLNNEKLKDVGMADIYKEYEFIYQENDQKYHGIIDLMLVYKTHIDIFDYKLKNIDDAAYQKQLLNYYNYIKKISDKPIKLFLYSLIDQKVEEVEVETIKI